jgi:hypothetical protein
VKCRKERIGLKWISLILINSRNRWMALSKHFAVKLWGLLNVKKPNHISACFYYIVKFSSAAFAELAYIDPATNQSVLDQVIQKFLGKVKSWQTVYKVQLSVCSGRWC